MASSYPLLPTARLPSDQDTERISKLSSNDDLDHQDMTAASQTRIEPKVKSHTTFLRQRWQNLTTTIADGWLLEWTSLACSIVLLTGLMILFRLFNGRPTQTWTAYLSFTTIIAILSKAIQVTLMLPVAASISQLGWIHFNKPRALIDFQKFDASSRGILGTVRLLIALPSSVAVLCALLTALSLGIEAAAQQCLRTTASQYLPTLRTIWRLDEFATNGGSVSPGLIHAGTSAVTARHFRAGGNVPPSHKAKPVTPGTLVYTCTGRSCVEPTPYVTLSLCSVCEDVSEDLVIYPPSCDANTSNIGSDCRVSLPGWTSLYIAEEALTLSAAPVTTFIDDFKSGLLVLANFAIIEQIFGVDASWYEQPVRYAAQSCTITLCANIYQLENTPQDRSTSGATELLLASVTHAERSNDPNMAGKWPGYTITVSEQSVSDAAKGKSTPWKGEDTTLGLDGVSTDFLRQYFLSLFNGTADIPRSDYLFDRTRTLELASEVAQQSTGSALWDGIVYTLRGYGFVDEDDLFYQVDSVINAITSSMGNWLRDLYPVSSDGSTGEPGNYRATQQSSYHIRWAWLTLPAVVEVLAFALLCTAISLTLEHKIPAWKSSTVAMMYHGLSRPEETSKLQYQMVSSMEDAAKQRRTTLAIRPDDCRLIDVEDELQINGERRHSQESSRSEHVEE